MKPHPLAPAKHPNWRRLKLLRSIQRCGAPSCPLMTHFKKPNTTANNNRREIADKLRGKGKVRGDNQFSFLPTKRFFSLSDTAAFNSRLFSSLPLPSKRPSYSQVLSRSPCPQKTNKLMSQKKEKKKLPKNINQAPKQSGPVAF